MRKPDSGALIDQCALRDAGRRVINRVFHRNPPLLGRCLVNIVGAGGGYADELQPSRLFNNRLIQNDFVGNDDIGVFDACQRLFRLGRLVVGYRSLLF